MSQQINLFNPVFLQQKKYFSTVTMAQALGLILLGTLSLAGYSQYELNKLTEESQRVKTQLTATQNQLTSISTDLAARQASKSVESEIRKVEADIRAQTLALTSLKDGNLGDTRGYSSYMTAFARQIIDGLWLTGFSVTGAGAGIRLDGKALEPERVPVYITRLKREPVMQGKSFATLGMRVPEIELSEKGDSTSSARQLTAANYIEFSLKSSDTAKAQGDVSGERTK